MYAQAIQSPEQGTCSWTAPCSGSSPTSSAPYSPPHTQIHTKSSFLILSLREAEYNAVVLCGLWRPSTETLDCCSFLCSWVSHRSLYMCWDKDRFLSSQVDTLHLFALGTYIYVCRRATWLDGRLKIGRRLQLKCLLIRSRVGFFLSFPNFSSMWDGWWSSTTGMRQIWLKVSQQSWIFLRILLCFGWQPDLQELIIKIWRVLTFFSPQNIATFGVFFFPNKAFVHLALDFCFGCHCSVNIRQKEKNTD